MINIWVRVNKAKEKISERERARVCVRVSKNKQVFFKGKERTGGIGDLLPRK